MKTVEHHDGIKQDEDHLLDKDTESASAKFNSNEVMELVQFQDHDDDEEIDDGDIVFGDASDQARTQEEPEEVVNIQPPLEAPEVVAPVFISAEMVRHFRTKAAITPHMIARGFAVTSEPLKKLKELLVEYDKGRHEAANVNVVPEAIVPAAVVPAAVVPAAIVPAATVPPIKASCWCKKPDNNEMIFCSFENCPHGWFHFKCIGLTRASANGLPNDWMCHLCK